jgi:hypothetical protein
LKPNDTPLGLLNGFKGNESMKWITKLGHIPKRKNRGGKFQDGTKMSSQMWVQGEINMHEQKKKGS